MLHPAARLEWHHAFYFRFCATFCLPHYLAFHLTACLAFYLPCYLNFCVAFYQRSLLGSMVHCILHSIAHSIVHSTLRCCSESPTAVSFAQRLRATRKVFCKKWQHCALLQKKDNNSRGALSQAQFLPHCLLKPSCSPFR